MYSSSAGACFHQRLACNSPCCQDCASTPSRQDNNLTPLCCGANKADSGSADACCHCLGNAALCVCSQFASQHQTRAAFCSNTMANSGLAKGAHCLSCNCKACSRRLTGIVFRSNLENRQKARAMTICPGNKLLPGLVCGAVEERYILRGAGRRSLKVERI